MPRGESDSCAFLQMHVGGGEARYKDDSFKMKPGRKVMRVVGGMKSTVHELVVRWKAAETDGLERERERETCLKEDVCCFACT